MGPRFLHIISEEDGLMGVLLAVKPYQNSANCFSKQKYCPKQ